MEANLMNCNDNETKNMGFPFKILEGYNEAIVCISDRGKVHLLNVISEQCSTMNTY
jgi:hypothetical protein